MNPDSGSAVWGDVRGDYVAARRAAIALRQAASALEASRAQRAELAARARQKWSGRYSRTFDSRLDQLQHESADLQAQMLAQATRLDLAADDAAIDQRSRVAERQRIMDERQQAAASQQAPPPVPASQAALRGLRVE